VKIFNEEMQTASKNNLQVILILELGEARALIDGMEEAIKSDKGTFERRKTWKLIYNKLRDYVVCR